MRASISERTTFRWDLAEELDAMGQYGFEALSVWRPKLSDLPSGEARRMLDAAGVRVSSLQWAGGFTGSDGRTFRESLTDAREAICDAAELGSDVLLVHTGCRGGHTLGHARRLVQEALERLAPVAEEHGVRLALKPTHPAASSGCGFFTELFDAWQFVEAIGQPAVGLALDLWHFGGQSGLLGLLPEISSRLVVVSLADCRGAPTADHERLAPGDGTLPLSRLVTAVADAGFTGDVEFEFVAKPVDFGCHGQPDDAAADLAAGYHEALQRARKAARSYGCLPLPAARRSQPAPTSGR